MTGMIQNEQEIEFEKSKNEKFDAPVGIMRCFTENQVEWVKCPCHVCVRRVPGTGWVFSPVSTVL